MKHLLLSLLLFSSSLFLYSQRNRYNLIFENNQTSLSNENKASIRNVTNRLAKGQHATFYPLTFDSLNKRYVYAKIAVKQADAIIAYAETVGFELINIPKNVPSAYKGYSVGVNMRYIINKDSISPAQAKKLLYNPFKDYLPQKQSQFFVIDPLKDTIIKGAEGTLIEIKAGAFLCKTPVKVELIEYYSNSDILTSGLSTTSKGNLIETGGTIFLDAKENGNPEKQVNLDPKKGLDVAFASKDQENMQVFVKDPQRPTEMNWILPGQSLISKRTSSWQLTETTVGVDGTVTTLNFNSQAEYDKYLEDQRIAAAKQKEEERIAAEIEKEANRVINERKQKLTNALNILQLGFINCDRFTGKVTAPFAITGDNTISADYYLVFIDVKGIIHGNINKNNASFGNIPTNANATLLAFSFIDDKAYFYKATITNGTISNAPIKLKAVSKTYMNEQLKLVN